MINETITQLFQIGLENTITNNLHFLIVPLFLTFIWIMYFLSWKDKQFEINQRDKKSSLMIGFLLFFIFFWIFYSTIILNKLKLDFLG